ncbi:corticosteroid-binding globulin [Tenrec ecaudatus]|uniref:corticosteroid-binding globulin n=1 Tax=Tenrec ecaudatus TaxID=94439 RepID=UPI003F5A2AAE
MLPVSYASLLWLSTCLWGIWALDPDPDMSLRNHHRHLAPANVDFGFSLYKHLVALTPDRNIFISPVSISISLAMLTLGARGSTRTQLLQGLGFNLTEIAEEAAVHRNFQHLRGLLLEADTSLEMTMGNTLFLDHRLDVLTSFSADIRHYYAPEALAIHFQDWVRASSHSSEYIKNKMQEKIPDQFPELETPGTFTLVNNISLKGTWAIPFDPESTSEEDFHVTEASSVKVPMMSQLGAVKQLNDSVLPCRLVQLDYTNNGTAFFILPHWGQMDTVIAALSRDTIQRWSKSLSVGQAHVSIPKIPISGTYDLRSTLEGMGISDLFTERADFSGITGEAPLKMWKVVHKTVLYMDEAGLTTTRAAAPAERPTPVPLSNQPPTIIKFNQPFLIGVFDSFTWSTLFLGKVTSPT